MDLITSGTIIVVGKQLLGKTFDVMGNDIAQLYQAGRDAIMKKATQKIKDNNDGKSTNLRVTRDVFWNGSFTDEEICAEYFGGILASSRSVDGQDDTGIYYVDLIKSLSSDQLKLHYAIYASLNKYFVSEPSKSNLNPGQETELHSEKIYFSLMELLQTLKLKDAGRDLHAIHAKGLIGDFQTQNHTLKSGKKQIPYLYVTPTSLGIQLYAVAHNKLDMWREFATVDLGDFDSLKPPKYHGKSIEDLLISAHIKDVEPATES